MNLPKNKLIVESARLAGNCMCHNSVRSSKIDIEPFRKKTRVTNRVFKILDAITRVVIAFWIVTICSWLLLLTRSVM